MTRPNTPRQATPNANEAMPVQPGKVVNDKNEGQNNGGWQQQKNRKRRTMVVGSRQMEGASRLSAGPVEADFKVWNISPTCKCDDIKAAVEAEGITVRNVIMLSKPEWRTRSFKITVPSEEKEKAMSPDIWDKGIKIGHFYPERKPKSL